MKKYCNLILLSVLLFALTSCYTNSPFSQESPQDPENQENPKPSNMMKVNEDIVTDSCYAVYDGKVISLRKETYSETTYETYAEKVIKTINNAVGVYCERFVFCEDGSVLDLYDTEYRINEVVEPSSKDYYLENECTVSLLEELNKTCGIKDIRFAYDGNAYHVYAGDGYIYELDSLPNIDYKKFKDPVLNDDGTLNCNSFPETSSWTNVIDYRLCDDFIIALTSDGKVLSSGIDFNLENIKKIDICNIDNMCSIPVALSSDGNLIFGEFEEDYSMAVTEYDRQMIEDLYKEIRQSVKLAEKITDLKDFLVDARTSSLQILGKKTNGSLISNADIYNSEYVTLFIPDNVVNFDVNNALDSHWAVKDGKLLWLLTPQEKHSEIDNAISVYASRFAFLENGDVADLYGRTPEEIKKEVIDPEIPDYDTLKEVTLSTIKHLHQNIGIKKFTTPAIADYVIRANDGNVYYLDILANLEGKVKVQKDILSADGKIYSEKFPETTSWENVVDYRICEDFIIALTSDEKVLTSGIEFSVENAVKINIIYLPSQRIPAVLTSDGKLIFGEIKEDFTNIEGATTEKLQEYYNGLQNTLIQAENFTDIVDFTYIDGNEFVILAQKSDGSLIATTNNIYNPEYVSQPE